MLNILDTDAAMISMWLHYSVHSSLNSMIRVKWLMLMLMLMLMLPGVQLLKFDLCCIQ